MKATGEVCQSCGTKIVTSEALVIQPWIQERNYIQIIRHPEVLDLLLKYSSASKNKPSVKEVVGKLDLVFGAVSGLSLAYITEVVVPLYARLGIKTEKFDSIELTEPIQRVFVKAVCSLSKNNHALEEFHEAQDGVVLVGKIKSDMRNWGGKVFIELREEEGLVQAKVQTILKGQLYDWGKSKSIIKAILEDLQRLELGA